MHQAYRRWGKVDGNDTTPMELDALMNDKGKNKGKEKCKQKGKGKSKDKPKEGTTDTSNVKCFFCEETGHSREDCSSLRRKQWVTSRVLTPSRKTDGSSL